VHDVRQYNCEKFSELFFFGVNCEQIRFDIAVSMKEAKPVITPSQHHLLNLENLLLLTTGHLPDNTCMEFES